MSEKVLGLTKTKVQELRDVYDCVIYTECFVPVVSVEQLKDICERIGYHWVGDDLQQDSGLVYNKGMKPKPAFVEIEELLKAVRLQAKEGGK